MARERIPAYIGFDCTAPSLHVGNLMTLMMLRRLQASGHQPIVILGGGTTQLGDPSGKDETRKMADRAEIKKNMTRIRRVIKRFLPKSRGQPALMLDNAQWLQNLRAIPFLREIGSQFSINKMLTLDSVRLRLEREQNLSFLEFNYMIFQAYDFLHLYRAYGCRLQMGGADQWGNIVNGVELARRLEGASLYGLTAPLLTTAGGAKMGKTAKGAVWLDADMLSPYDYWQYWRNRQDADVGLFLRIFTDLSLDEIQRLEKLQGRDLNQAKKRLAHEACAMAHGKRAAEAAARGASAAFKEGGTDASTGARTDASTRAGTLPTRFITKAQIQKGVGVLEAFVLANLAASNSEARRYVRAGAIKINDETIHDEAMQIKSNMLPAKLSLGKKKHALLKIKK